MYTPMYRFRYKFDSKQNKYIPTNEWFMDKVVVRRQGGKLNKYQKGKNLPTAPKAEDRYKNGYKYGSHLTLWSNGDGINRSGVISNNKIQYGRFPAIIQRDIRENSSDILNQDTTYYEVPSFTAFPILFQTPNPLEQSKIPALIKPKVKIRQASSKDKNRSEYETLKRRFNTAWNLAK